MRKSIFMYSLFALAYFGFSILPLTEVRAQEKISIESGNNQSAKRGEVFTQTVELQVTGGSPPVTIFFGDSKGVSINTSSTGTFLQSRNLATDNNGALTIHVKANMDSLYGKCAITAVILPGLTISTKFTGTITDVLQFLNNSGHPITTATRSVVEGATPGANIGAAVSATHWALADNDDSTGSDVDLVYSLAGDDADSFDIDSDTGQLKTKAGVTYTAGATYNVTVQVEDRAEDPARSDDTIDVTINVNSPPSPDPPPPSVQPQPPADLQQQTEINAGTSESLTVRCIDSRTVALSWDIPTALNPDTIMYEYSIDGGSTWTSTGSTDTSITITRDGICDLSADQFKIRAMNHTNGTRSFVIISATTIQRQRRVIQECPVGWIRSDGFAGRTRRALIYEVNLEMDIRNPVSIYKPVWVAIYVHPDEGLENLDGWKLQVAVPYNHHRDYLLTAENSVVVDAGFVAGGFAFIENPKENPFPMVGMGFTGSPVPGFDYRLYDETGRRVDFGISCYKRFDVFQVLRNAEDPRVLRKVLLESFDWDQWFLRSEWTVPSPVPAAPSQKKGNIVGTWAGLKKQ